MLGSPAFATTTNTPPKQVIHRLIVIKDGYAWMLNCIDDTGNAGESSGKIFESVVESLTPLSPAPKEAVTVKEIKKH